MYYNESNSCIFVNVIEIYKFKAKDSEINPAPIDNIKKAGLYVYIYGFNVHYHVIAVDEILDIHKYFIKKHDVGFVKRFRKNESQFLCLV